MGWRFNWVSSNANEFNDDYHVVFTKDELATGKVDHNFNLEAFPGTDAPGISVFFKDRNGEIFHTYSAYARGTETTMNTYNYRASSTTCVAGFVREVIPVILVAAHPIHHVDTGSATQHFAHRQGKGAPIDSGIWLSPKAPVPLGPEIGEPLIGVHNTRHVIVATSLKQQHADIGILGRTARYHRARGAGPTDDGVVVRFQLGRELSLIRTNTLDEIYR
jgi:hypothetical protein